MVLSDTPIHDHDLIQADAALLELAHWLKQERYRFTSVTPVTHQRNNARATAQQAFTLRDVFGWNRPFSLALLDDDRLQLMSAAQVLDEQGKAFRSQVRWSTLDDLLLVHSGYPTDRTDAVFFGPDSYRFARVIQAHLQTHAHRIQRAVDIGCGSGIGGLLIAKAVPRAEVMGVDINPLALRYTQVNAAAAGVTNLTAQRSDILADTSGTFDLIVANPPYMVDGQERTYRHGGGNLGSDLSLRILEQACERLSVGGSLLLYSGIAIVEGRDGFLEAVRLRLAGPGWSWTYEEIDPDVFGEQLDEPGYEAVERIAAVSLTVTRVH
ncbi:class I SAM-dependent methyltransferase [Pseudomonas entomophila]|uniref:methyltransferase n=1 Tax=Pseudomonas entomophila TaxID=312306 RepID=UPI0015E32FBA|nr:class I SAM-dependent methyltransferase [Pseudomonas entomophila]MBA1189605.1 class I SAM-dependent methyltransferase [Pseudomonas entomophila]